MTETEYDEYAPEPVVFSRPAWKFVGGGRKGSLTVIMDLNPTGCSECGDPLEAPALMYRCEFYPPEKDEVTKKVHPAKRRHALPKEEL